MNNTNLYYKIANTIVDNILDEYTTLENPNHPVTKYSAVIINDYTNYRGPFDLILFKDKDVLLFIKTTPTTKSSVIGINNRLSNTFRNYLNAVNIRDYKLNDLKIPLIEKLNQTYKLNINPPLSTIKVYWNLKLDLTFYNNTTLFTETQIQNLYV